MALGACHGAWGLGLAMGAWGLGLAMGLAMGLAWRLHGACLGGWRGGGNRMEQKLGNDAVEVCTQATGPCMEPYVRTIRTN